MDNLRPVRALFSLGILSAALSAGGLLCPEEAYAQYDAHPPPPPPPPPPGYGYGYPYGYGPPPPPPPRRRYYYIDREPLYALDLGFDVEGAVPVGVNVPGASDGSGVRGGGGFKLRAGEQFRFAHIRFTPEVGYGYDHLWATDDSGNERGWDMNRLFVGARISFGRFIVPVFYAHVGYGWRQDSNPSVDGTGGVAYDVGGALDFRIIPRVGFGVHLEYAAIDIPTQPQWVAIGGHADFLF